MLKITTFSKKLIRKKLHWLRKLCKILVVHPVYVCILYNVHTYYSHLYTLYEQIPDGARRTSRNSSLFKYISTLFAEAGDALESFIEITRRVPGIRWTFEEMAGGNVQYYIMFFTLFRPHVRRSVGSKCVCVEGGEGWRRRFYTVKLRSRGILFSSTYLYSQYLLYTFGDFRY